MVSVGEFVSVLMPEITRRRSRCHRPRRSRYTSLCYHHTQFEGFSHICTTFSLEMGKDASSLAGPLCFVSFFFLFRHTAGRLYAFSIYLPHGYRSIAHSKHSTDTCSSFLFRGFIFSSLPRQVSQCCPSWETASCRSSTAYRVPLRYGVNFFVPSGNSWEKFSSYHINCCCCC